MLEHIRLNKKSLKYFYKRGARLPNLRIPDYWLLGCYESFGTFYITATEKNYNLQIRKRVPAAFKII